jgi:hypothetical protein
VNFILNGSVSAPRAKQGVALGWADLDVRVLTQKVGAHTKDQSSSSAHDDNEGIGGGITQPIILEAPLLGKSQKSGTRGLRRLEATLTDRAARYWRRKNNCVSELAVRSTGKQCQQLKYHWSRLCQPQFHLPRTVPQSVVHHLEKSCWAQRKVSKKSVGKSEKKCSAKRSSAIPKNVLNNW